MPLASGSRVGVYEVIAPIGRGGMGEVYRARDTTLHREVAVKVLPDAFAQDRDRLLRFEREARLLAALNHPNVAAIFGLEEHGASKLLIMELAEGSTLGEKLAAGPLPIDEAVAIATGIASGLEAAHAAGIIHRDLKPANVMVRPDGSVKVLDFGLARVAEPGGGAIDASHSPTVTSAATNEGVVLGTAAYMSPEQARGKTLDKRTDIFSFGCVLYECLAGRQPFAGETVSDILSAILRGEPDWSALPAETPARVRDLLRRCLNKDLKRRLHDIADARIELEEPPGSETAAAAPAPSRGGRLAVALGGALLGAAIATAAVLFLRPAAPRTSPAVVRAVLPPPPGDRLVARWSPVVAVSPDGRTIVYSANHGGKQMLLRRALDGVQTEPIAGTERGIAPFFSPDGQWIGFFTVDELKKVPLAGGTAVLLSKVPPITCGGSWGEDGRIVLAPTFNGALVTVPETGGESHPLTRLDSSRGEHAHLYPQSLPGGRGVLFTVRLGKDFADTRASNIAVLDSAKGTWTTVLEGASFARYAAGRLVFVRGDSVFSTRFDVSGLAVTGTAAAITESVAVDPARGFGNFEISAAGTLVYLEGPPNPEENRTAVLALDRNGKESAIPLPPAEYRMAVLSPDGGRLAVTRWARMRGTIAIYERERRILSTLTPEPGSHFCPVWSPDGRRIAFSRFAETSPALSVKNADGSGEIEALTDQSGDAEFPNSWSPDGKAILYTVAYTEDRGPKRKRGSSDLWIVSPGDPKSARPWFETPFRETAAAFSPDGRWVAYVSQESGAYEVFVRPYPGPGAGIKISEDAAEPLWSRDGRTLYYRSGDEAKLFAVAIQSSSALVVSPPRLVFTAEIDARGREDDYRHYDVSPDGQEFIGVRTVRPPAPERRLSIVTDWPATLGP